MQQHWAKSIPVILLLILLTISTSLVVVAFQQQKSTPREDARQIYINPYPATIQADRFGFGLSKQADEPVARNRWRSAKYLAPGDADAKHQHQIGSTPSSIGKSEQSQVAEWPFFKSLISTRNNQNIRAMETQSSQELPIIEPTTTTTTTTTAGPTTTTATSNNYLEPEQTTTPISTSTSTSTSTTTTTTTSTTTTTTTPAPETTEQPPETTMVAKKRDDPLFPANLHKSIQDAVNKIVKMGETSEAEKAPVVMQNKETRNSLSLNVLLKNFGMNNLSNLDQILLKSRLRPNGTSSGGLSDQKIEIRGLQKEVIDGKPLAASVEGEKEEAEEDNSNNQDNNEDEYRMAECKIEYTMRHVNISLMNGPRGDYTCDYIIDRKLTSSTPERGREALALAKVCKLQLTSQFFSNESNHQQCNSTYLSIGELKFCYLMQPAASMSSPTLDRSFEFPMEREAFDIKMVHKSARLDEANEGAEIHLEIKPLADAECSSPSRRRQQEPELKKVTTTTTTTTMAPAEVVGDSEQPSARSITTVNNHAPARRKFIVKVAPERPQLHPLNRFKVSQSFDVGSRPTPYSSPLAYSSDTNETMFSLCDGLVHNMAAGHLATPEYPHYYPANTSCSFDIRRASPMHCQLFLHFRDFDLVNNMPPSESQCQDDYLQIGHTRYCNKYAMIGHKMQLDFPASTNHSIKLTFRSDHMQSGRGFLVRYQQLLCNSTTTKQQKLTTRLGEQQVTQSTVSVPMQQPDFSLALKTTAAPSSVNKSTKISPKTPKPVPQNLNQTTTMVASTSSLVQSVELADTLPVRQQRQDSHCSSVYNEMSFLIKSPNYPNDYGNNLECLYYVRRNTSQVCYVELTFIKFDLEADADCRYDYLEINNVRLCGSLKDLAHKTTRIYFFNEPIKLIKFRSDDSGSRPGFLLRIDQLQCAPSDGSIMRQPVQLPATTTRLRSSPNVSRTFEYDDTSLNSNSRPQLQPQTEAQSQSKPSGRQLDLLRPQTRPKAPACEQVLFGKEVTIKSPSWPESYDNDENLSSCRYQIQRLASGKNKICQLELRFVNLRLGVSDCIDVDGYEVLCGFNTRNMVNYYPFDRQSHLTITFFTGTLSGKLARSLQLSKPAEPVSSTRAPLRFMIVAKQHECIDGFLAPQSELQTNGYNQTNLLYSLSPLINTKNQSQLNYDFSSSVPAPPSSTSSSSSSNNNNNNKMFSLLTPLPPLTCPDGSTVLRNDELYSLHYPLGFSKGGTHCSVEMVRQSEAMCQLELEFLDLDLPSDTNCQSHYLQVDQFRFCHLRQVDRRGAQKRVLQLSFADQKYHTITFHADSSAENANRRGFLIRHRQLECRSSGGEKLPKEVESTREEPLVSRKLIGSHILASNLSQMEHSGSNNNNNNNNNKCLVNYNQFNGIMSSSSILSKGSQAHSLSISSSRNTCQVNIKLLPGYCQVQLSFGEFDLAPRTLNQFCFDYLELDGVAYCGQELRNTSRLLGPVDPLNQRQVHLEYSTSSSSANSSVPYTFRAIFKQLECQPPEALPRDLSKPSTTTTTSTTPTPLPASQLSSLNEQELPKVEFREILVKSEFFELNSAKLSKSLASYDPNMFVIYRLKRMSAQVCKLRLIFYQFDLEPSPGCKRDFLDINNVDRLCGQLGSDSTSSRRDYEWPQGDSKDFLISFVSDTQRQRDGFLVFGQQLLTNCSSRLGSSSMNETSPSPSPSPNPMVTYDEEPQPNKKQQQQEKQPNDNCYKLFYEPKFSVTSPNWPQKYVANSTCYYLIQKSSPEICSLNVGVLSLVLGSEEVAESDTCDTSSKDHLLIDGQAHCGLLSRPRMLQLDFDQRQFIALKFVSHTGSGFGFYLEVTQTRCNATSPSTSTSTSTTTTTTPAPTTTAEQLEQTDGAQNKGCHQLITEEVSFLESDNFPRPYGHNQDCLYAFRRPNNSVCALDVVFNHFELEESAECQSDYLEIDFHRLCGSYPSLHRRRFNYFGQEPDKLIRFRSDASQARSGFSLQVAQVSGAECERPDETSERPTTSSDLINYLPSSPERRSTGGSVAIGAEPSGGTLCQFVYQRERQFLVSPNYHERRHHYDNNLHCQYKLLAKSYDFCSLRLTFQDLSLESSSDCHQDYLLIDSQRYCGGGNNNNNNSIELPFPESLPREIHLVYHTSAHSNEGRGFKLLAEQLACRSAASSSPSSTAEQRQQRRFKFGQLSYPRNYVSEPSSSLKLPQAPSADALGSHPKSAQNNEPSLVAEEDNEDDEMTLRKDIVVAKRFVGAA